MTEEERIALSAAYKLAYRARSQAWEAYSAARKAVRKEPDRAAQFRLSAAMERAGQAYHRARAEELRLADRLGLDVPRGPVQQEPQAPTPTYRTRQLRHRWRGRRRRR